MIIFLYDLISNVLKEQPYCCLNVGLVSVYVLEYIGQSEASLKSDSHFPKKNLLFASMIALQKC